MERLEFSIRIDRPVKEVYETMLNEGTFSKCAARLKIITLQTLKNICEKS